jgi:2-polyprenyl-3-methyl-5-hydroxy-6-metoxy-1,4-benzoquinol methylase
MKNIEEKDKVYRNKDFFGCLVESQFENGMELLHSIPNMPVKCSVSNKETDYKKDYVMDFNVYIDKATGMIQVNPLVPLDILYETQHNDSNGGTWLQHHLEFKDFILKNGQRNVIEFGAGSGILSKLFLKENKDCKWTILDINTDLLKDREDISVIKGEINKDSEISEEYDTFIHSHLIEHIYNPEDFLELLGEKSKYDSNHIFSLPNLRVWLEKKHSNTIFFEHSLFLEEAFLDFLLKKNGFEIIEKSYYKDHSIFYFCKNKKRNLLDNNTPIDRYKENLKKYKDYVESIENYTKHILDNVKEGDDVFLFGAHIFSQILLKMGLEQVNIISILDNSPLKIGKRLYGFEHTISSPEIISKYKKPIVVLHAGSYQEEIKNQLTKINQNVIILEIEKNK